MAIQWLSGSVTQGSADAFASAEVATGLSTVNTGYRVREIWYFLPAFVEVDSDITMQWSRRSATALVSSTDRRLLHSATKQVAITTSGQFVQDRVLRFEFPKDLDLIIVEDPIYLLIDSTGTSLANILSARIYYEQVRLTETQKLAALSESANA